MSSKEIKKIVRMNFEVPERISRLAELAISDLYWGPVSPRDDWEEENYKGFGFACKEISEWVQELPCQLWIDVDCDCVMTCEPEGQEVEGEYIEPFWESIYYIDSRKELAGYLLDESLAGYL